MAIITTVRVSEIEDIKKVIAAGLESLGHVGIDISTIKFNTEESDKGFSVDFKLQEDIPLVKPGKSLFNKALEGRN